jgi:hypothetical protein
MTQTIYVVLGSTGEHSDRSEWLVKAFHSQAEAESYVTFLTTKRQEVAAPKWELEWDERASVEAKMRAFDPNYAEDYTGTSWWVSEVELVASAEAGK